MTLSGTYKNDGYGSQCGGHSGGPLERSARVGARERRGLGLRGLGCTRGVEGRYEGGKRPKG